MFPGPVPLRADEDTAPIAQVIEEAALGQTELYSVVKAQSSAPHVVERAKLLLLHSKVMDHNLEVK